MDLQIQAQLRQSQKLVMTPALRQAIEILQYNAVELKAYIDEQMLENPVLEYSEEVDGTLRSELESKVELAQDTLDKIQWLSGDGQGYASYRANYYDPDQNYNYEQFATAGETLHDHLYSQLRMLRLAEKDYDLAKYLIDRIDAQGYLYIDIEEVKATFLIDSVSVEKMIAFLQTFEPFGVAARNLAECLTIQLRMKKIDDPIALQIIEFQLDDLANNRIKQIAKALEQSCDRVQQSCDLIKSLNPRPGLAYGKSANIRYLEPDIHLKKIDGEYVIFMNESAFPRLRLNHYYQTILQARQVDSATVNYINGKLNSALGVIKSLEQRSSTIYSVVAAIVDRQVEFFDKGPLYLKKLNLKDVADAVGVHESTVSRAINGKYLQCQRGIFELKFFFPSGVSSAESVKSVISDIIAHEDVHKPVSDQKIADQLAQIGVKISRRTIAKYRESLGIAGSAKRKRY
ncbi:MAG: RNA polymerase sigma-54 factor [Clostridiales bacterium]|nr:MAG: RNA polymerase sigma-54 factor [Clostridiales bacterium]